MADTQAVNALNATKIGAGVLGILGGVWILGIAYFGVGMAAVFAGSSNTQAQLASVVAVGIPVASIVGGAIAFVASGAGAALMVFGAAGALGIYGASTMTLAPIVLSGVGGALSLFEAAKADVSDRGEPTPVLPSLKSFYDIAIPLAWPVIRAACGWNLAVHGWGKVSRGPSAFAKAFGDLGFEPALMWVWGALFIEFVGGIALIVGLFTRFFAAIAAVEMLIITFIYWKTGFSWLNRGYEYVLLWGWVCFAIALRGGGPYSLDRKLGTEL